MKRIAFLLVALWLALMAAQALAATEATPFVTDLIAGNPNNNGQDIGDVLVWEEDGDDGVMLKIKILIPDSSPWALGETHIAVATSLAGIPQTRTGNPPPGQFPYTMTHNPFVEEYLLTIPKPGDYLYIAVHAEAHTGSQNDLSLPCIATMTINTPPGDLDTPSYFNLTVDDGGILGGKSYNAWCASTQHGVGIQIPYDVRVFSSYAAELPTCLFNGAEDWDAINWILNKVSVPKDYNWVEVQVAIWTLLGETLPVSDFPDFDSEKVNALVDEAVKNGATFVPGCNDVVAIILIPVFSNDCLADVCCNLAGQPVIIPVPVPCNGEETAWAEGSQFNGRNWAMYFNYGTPPSSSAALFAPAPASTPKSFGYRSLFNRSPFRR